MVHRLRRGHGLWHRFAGGAPSRQGCFPHSSSRGDPQLLSLLSALLLWCPSEAAAVPTLAKDHNPLHHPIVLVHGATIHGANLHVGPLDLGEYFRDVVPFLSAAGTPVKVAVLSTDGSIGERAAVLKNFLETEFRGQMVNLVAHSLGGLDSRYMISVLKTTQVSSLTTIGTPHLGTPLADWAVDQMRNGGLWYYFFRLIGYDLGTRRFLPELTTNSMQLFNERVPNSPEVKYYSVKAFGKFSNGTLSALLWLPGRWLEGRNHPLGAGGHDGMVPLASQGWGTEIATVELDHLGQMNHHELRLLNLTTQAQQLYVTVHANLEAEGH